MPHKTHWLLSLALILTSSAQAADEDLHKTVKELRSQVEILTTRLLQLEKRLNNKEIPEQLKTSKSAEVKKVEIGDTKGSFKIPGTETSLAIGGYAKLDAIYNSQSVGALPAQILVTKCCNLDPFQFKAMIKKRIKSPFMHDKVDFG